jgi:hypothetical protein
MSTTLMPAGQWAQKEFEFAKLGDPRRNKRLVNIATHLAANPDGTLPQAFEEWAELKAAYRFFNNGAVDFEKVLAPHLERTRLRCREPGEYLIIEDSTLLDYSKHWARQDLGVIGDGKGRGFELHSALAVRIEAWTLEQRPEGQVIGLFDQRCRRPRPAPRGESRGERLKRPRKSSWWAAAFEWAGPPPRECTWTYVADRESDFYEPMQICQRQGVDFIIRGCQDRRLADEAGRLREALAGAAALGYSQVEVGARGGDPARTAQVEIRSVQVDLDGPWRPGGWQEPLREVTVVEVQEVNPPKELKGEPLHWILLTSFDCASLAKAKRVIGRYTARWWVEEYHKALKSGAGVEHSQLEQASRLEPLIAVLAVVAVRLLNTKMLARSRPEGPEAAKSFGEQALRILEKKFGRPKGGWTNEKVLVATARLGGFLARKHDGMPGWQTIWRGWHRLMWMVDGLDILNES